MSLANVTTVFSSARILGFRLDGNRVFLMRSDGFDTDAEGFGWVLDDQLPDLRFFESCLSERWQELREQRVVRPESTARRLPHAIPASMVR